MRTHYSVMDLGERYGARFSTLEEMAPCFGIDANVFIQAWLEGRLPLYIYFGNESRPCTIRGCVSAKVHEHVMHDILYGRDFYQSKASPDNDVLMFVPETPLVCKTKFRGDYRLSTGTHANVEKGTHGHVNNRYPIGVSARGRIADGAVGTLEGLGTLMGPSAQEYMAGAFNPEQAAINKVRQQNQQAAGKAIYDNTKGAVTDAYQRNGLAGAAAMVVTASVAELAGTKGLGTVEKVGTLGDVAKLGKAIELEKLEGYLGTYKGQKVLLQNVDVVKMDYFRRDRAEAAMLRSQFRSVRTKFVKSIANNPDVAKRFTLEQIDGLSNGITPSGWVVHHKLPLDDSGTNALDNLVLIKDSPEHTVLTNAQKKITNGLPHEASKEVLWPIPQGLVYP
ncbi:HNH endonuclease [Yersinia pseudotuberculosis]|uniref:HNH endonuclease n=3 Tax=Yersinia TaxID=629 RepID=A0A0H3B0F8_YERPY|nr:DNase/tRNase domain of colicin-like bacteriocin family protein [Yersinia pseudotuberculosis YPIII]AYW86711.1 HNH endonuclease [Yersinia pseudotuberculosis]AYX01348.1 HNH endonuclease [Yersinia pseudotuberculosis]AZA29104.1 HNH endonuclease [Yersinia pseudotuberculosis]CNF85921.1 HNH endonuclease domain-containing protein [Yersinia pseudotuberculosis]